MALPEQRQSLFTTTNKNLDLGYVASALMSGVSIDPNFTFSQARQPQCFHIQAPDTKLRLLHISHFVS